MICDGCDAILSTFTVGCPECRRISYDRVMTIESLPLMVDKDLIELVTEEVDANG